MRGDYYFSELDRIYNITNGVDGVYEDPEKEGTLIYKNGETLIGGIPANIFYVDEFECGDMCYVKDAQKGSKKQFKPYYRQNERW